MYRGPILLSLLSVIAVSEALYKRWIPNTNFANASNWMEQRVPCAQDKAMFPRDKRVSIFVQSPHPLTDLLMPLDGEFILSHGAGFIAASWEDPGCGQGRFINFHNADRDQWTDPRLWRSAMTIDDLDSDRFLFAVDAESVPCRYDDVIFSPDTSFQVQFKATGSDVQIRSISVLGKKFTDNEEFSQYLQSPTGKLQFPGPSRPQVTNLRCQDSTGCLCGNEGMLQEICSALLQDTGNKCPAVPCADPLLPVGHCCGVCGVLISMDYSSAFSLEAYRSRLLHMILSLEKYSSVKLAISKVRNPSAILGLVQVGEELKIQILLIDGKEGALAGSDALQLGYDIMADIDTHGHSFGITKAEMRFTTGGVTSPQTAPSMSAGAISAIVIGVVLGLSIIGASYFLYRMDDCRIPYLWSFQFWRNGSRLEDTVSEDRRGFQNPIFDPTSENIQDLAVGEDNMKEVTVQEGGFHFSNSVFDLNIDV